MMWNLAVRGVRVTLFQTGSHAKVNRTAPAPRLAGSGDRHFILDQWHELRRQILQNLHGQRTGKFVIGPPFARHIRDRQ